MNIDAYVRLTRIEHALLLCVAVIAGQIMVLHSYPPILFALLTFIPPFMIEVAAFSINDYFDVEVDRRNGRADRPLVTGEIPKENALYLSVAAAIIGVADSWFINPACFVIALAVAGASFLYSFKLKDMGLVGNSYVGATMAVPFVFGNLSVFPTIMSSVGLLAVIAFLAGLGREIMGAVRDVEGDREREGAGTFPMLVGAQAALIFSAILYGSAILLSFVPFFTIPEYTGNLNYLILVGFCDVILAWIMGMSIGDSRGFLKRARMLSLLAMALGLLAFLVGAYKFA
ncbi:Digeranylgeranylglyceryl phosphate synthase [uncultured archaeon]|nr:Digeranylgeranylglyceryl phosphate synthase [uncultured archaeon]